MSILGVTIVSETVYTKLAPSGLMQGSFRIVDNTTNVFHDSEDGEYNALADYKEIDRVEGQLVTFKQTTVEFVPYALQDTVQPLPDGWSELPLSNRIGIVVCCVVAFCLFFVVTGFA